jgi:hypothetical protein
LQTSSETLWPDDIYTLFYRLKVGLLKEGRERILTGLERTGSNAQCSLNSSDSHSSAEGSVTAADASKMEHLPNKENCQPSSSIRVSSLSLAERLAHHTASCISDTVRLRKQDALDLVKVYLFIFVSLQSRSLPQFSAH